MKIYNPFKTIHKYKIVKFKDNKYGVRRTFKTI